MFAAMDDIASVPPVITRRRLRYAGTCIRCGARLDAGVTADYDRSAKVVSCVECPTLDLGPSFVASEDLPRRLLPGAPLSAPETAPAARAIPAFVPDRSELPRAPVTPVMPDVVERGRPFVPPALDVVDGVAGGSAAREYLRRHDSREQRVHETHPHIGRFLMAVTDDPSSTKAWSTGAEGERAVAKRLDAIACDRVRVLHDRRIPRSTANIDHIAVCETGVYVIDAKRYRGQRPKRRIEGGFLTPRTELLYLGGRNRTPLVEGVRRQVGLVERALAGEDVAVAGILCFVEADWPLLGGPFTVRGVEAMWPKKLAKLLVRPGSLSAERIADLQWRLHEAFPRARNAGS